METFQLIFSGDRCGNYSKLPIDEHFKLLNFSENSRKKIASSKHAILKRNLDYKSAISQQERLISLGLETTIKLELNAKLFQLGFKTNEKTPDSPAQTEDNNRPLSSDNPTENTDTEKFDSTQIKFADKQFTDPGVYARPGSYKVEGTHQNSFIQLKSLSYSLRGLGLVAISAYIGLTIQSYLIIFVLSLGVSNTIASVMGVLFFFGITIALPKIIQPLQYIEISKDSRSIHLIENPSFIFGRHKMTWHEQASGNEGEFSFSANNAEADGGHDTYNWNAKLQIGDISQKSIVDIQSSIVEGTAVETAITIIKQFKKAFNLFSPNAEQINWKMQTPSVITDSQNKVVALIYMQPKKAYYIINNKLSDDLLLNAFCTYILRDRLV